MTTITTTMIWQLAALLLVALCHQISCHHVPIDPYVYQYNPYSFGYDVEDNYGNKQWKQEKSVNPMEVQGSYGYRDNNGIYREVVYIADKDGFRANIKSNEPGVAGTKEPAGVKMESYSHHQPAPVYASSKQVNPSYGAPSYYTRRRAA